MHMQDLFINCKLLSRSLVVLLALLYNAVACVFMPYHLYGMAKPTFLLFQLAAALCTYDVNAATQPLAIHHEVLHALACIDVDPSR